MKEFENNAGQGDIVFFKVDSIPATAIEQTSKDTYHIVAHSETGHHHVVEKSKAKFYSDPADLMRCFLKVEADHADLTHLRSFDTHEPIRLKTGNYEIHRQREQGPDGWRRLED